MWLNIIIKLWWRILHYLHHSIMWWRMPYYLHHLAMWWWMPHYLHHSTMWWWMPHHLHHYALWWSMSQYSALWWQTSWDCNPWQIVLFFICIVGDRCHILNIMVTNVTRLQPLANISCIVVTNVMRLQSLTKSHIQLCIVEFDAFPRSSITLVHIKFQSLICHANPYVCFRVLCATISEKCFSEIILIIHLY